MGVRGDKKRGKGDEGQEEVTRVEGTGKKIVGTVKWE